MPLTLFDTRTGARQELPDDPIRVYVCGITPYDTTHLGHAFTYVHFDALVRALRWLGREVVYVQNVTDIDDSILQRASRLGMDWRALGDEGTRRYVADMQALGVRPPDRFVRATEVIPTILEMTQGLVGSGHAYVAPGRSVFFRVASHPRFGELSRLSRDEMLRIAAAQDDADVDDPRKEDPLDFALWKGWSGTEDEPRWDSPWGPGRPGWHIECSAINQRFHGPQVSIHGGGADLIYPHHEAETAQNESFTGVRPFVRVWMHTAMTRMGGEKMSKSLGNMIFASDLIARYGPDPVRLFLLEHHYREACEWSEEEQQAAVERVDRLRAAAAGPDRESGAREAFAAALGDDLDVPRALDAVESASGPAVRELAGVLGLVLA